MNSHEFTVHVHIIGGDDVDKEKALVELIQLMETMHALSLGKENLYSCYNRSSTYPVISSYSIENISDVLQDDKPNYNDDKPNYVSVEERSD